MSIFPEEEGESVIRPEGTVQRIPGTVVGHVAGFFGVGLCPRLDHIVFCIGPFASVPYDADQARRVIEILRGMIKEVERGKE